MRKVGLWRDSSERLTLDIDGVSAEDYPAICNQIATAFALKPDFDSAVIGLDQIFWDYRRDEQIVGLDWDIWMQFMIVAKTEESESLVREIASWLIVTGGFTAGKQI